jgi:hypothetical protein
MIDPVLTLAMSMHSAKGVYALLLGSGVSRSSAIPTGWDVVLDLIRKLAHANGESCAPDPEAWYKSLAGSEPDYSDILDQLTKSSAERNLLLRSYFEPTEEDREEGRKIPSPAHLAIATLVAKGYVRVIVTTNFDRLMEQALTDVGVQPTVISTTDAVQGALPLVHAPCTIIKVHGDYLDARIRNTRVELSSYDKPMNDLLDRVFDEYGLVISGWSAEWDVALRAAMERCSTHRFGTYWTAYKGNVGLDAEKLAGLRRAAMVSVSDADTFFRELSEKIGALEDFTLSDPVSPKVAVARMKRYLARPEERINLHELLRVETERVYTVFMSPKFTPMQNLVPDLVARRLRDYEDEMGVLVPMLVCGGYWASEIQFDILSASIKRVADVAPERGSRCVGINLHTYPAMLGFYATGLGGLAHGNYGLLKHLMGMKLQVDGYGEDTVATGALVPGAVLERGYAKDLLIGRNLHFTPFNDYVFDVLRDWLRDYLPNDASYDHTFDWFEYLIGLVHCDLIAKPQQTEDVEQSTGCLRGPFGRFLWNHRDSNGILKRTHFEAGGPYPEAVTAAVRAGLFGSTAQNPKYERLSLIKLGFDRYLMAVRNNMGVF